MAPLTIDSFFKPTSNPSTSTKRARAASPALSTSAPTKKAKSTPATKDSGPKLKKSHSPGWDKPHFSQDPPSTPNAKKCVEKWNLLAPYDTTITEECWGRYYEERCALEIMNTCGSEKWKKIESEELMQKTDVLLKEAGGILAEVMRASTGLEEERKEMMAETLKGSLYYLTLWGNEEDGANDSPNRTSFSPRSVDCKTRLYSPFGLGTSIDFEYTYHYRMFRDEYKCAVGAVSSREISDCNGTTPTSCSAALNQRKPTGPAESGTKLFNWNGKTTSSIAATNMLSFEEMMFGCIGWLSPYLLYKLLCAGSTAGIYQEPISYHVDGMLEKFKKFAGET